MHRWATFFLFCCLLLIEYRSATAATAAFRSKQAQVFPNRAASPRSALHSACSPTSDNASAQHWVGQGCLTSYAVTALADLVQAADLIVRGQVTAVHSFWNADHSSIESEITLAIAYPLLGHSLRRLTVRTPGGYLAEEGIGMSSLHAATFAVGEEVLLFAHQQESAWQVVNGAAGKFLVQADQVYNADLALAQPLSGILPTVVDLVRRRGLGSQLPLVWRTLPSPTTLTPVHILAAQVDARRWATPHATATFYIHLNTTQIGDEGERTAFRNAILAAAASWSSVASADFTVTYAGETEATQTSYNGVNEVLFMHKGVKERAAAAQVWYTDSQTIVEADIWINDDYAWNATGTPTANEVDLQSALLHEFGHWLVLGHAADERAVMFPRLATGQLKRALQQSDILGISTIYPR